MRLIIKLNGTEERVPSHNQNLLNGYIHKCLGKDNKYHDAKNDYCISMLYGGKLNPDKETLDFSKGGYFVITSQNTEFINKILMRIISNSDLFCGITTNRFDTITEKFIDGWNHFATLSPFLVKEYSEDKSYRFATILDPDFESVLERRLKRKLSKIRGEEVDLKVLIKPHESHKVKTVLIKKIINKANQCHVSINCSKEIAEQIYNLGLGESTGCGFGTIYKTENVKDYKEKFLI